MTREEFARKIRWPFIIWFTGLMSIVAMTPQLIKIIITQKVEDLSLSMFALTFFIQSAFSLEGYFTRNKVLMFCPGGAAIVTLNIVILILIFS